MDDISALLADPATSIAVIGATDTPGKYGGKVYRDLKSKGFDVTPINPRRSTVDGDPALRSPTAMTEPPDLAVFVVPPPAALKIIRETLDPTATAVWLQPGAESDETVRFLEEAGFGYLANSCVMVRSHAHT